MHVNVNVKVLCGIFANNINNLRRKKKSHLTACEKLFDDMRF